MESRIRCRIAVIITSYNRIEKTRRCLDSLLDQSRTLDLTVYLLDDGSTDGTQDAIRSQYPQVRLICGDGNNYWSGGMRKAWQEAMNDKYDIYVWLNDDVILDGDALDRMLSWNERFDGSILGGAMREPNGNIISYSGGVRHRNHPMKYSRLTPDAECALEVDVLNGNFVLVPDAIVRVLGGFAAYLIHQGADYEYCLRAKCKRIPVMLLPGSFGVCAGNIARVKKRGFNGLKRMTSMKEMPLKAFLPYYREHCGRLWPIWLLRLYLGSMIKGC